MNKLFEPYQHCFEYCDIPMVFKGIEIDPFKMKDYKTFELASYCLEFEPYDLEDITLISLKRYSFIMEIVRRVTSGEFKDNLQYAHTYQLLVLSFKTLMDTVFKNYYFIPYDINNPTRKKSFTLVPHDESSELEIVVITEKEFETLYRLILYQNGKDITYKDKYPLNIRREAERILSLINGQKKHIPTTLEKQIDIVFTRVKDYTLIKEMPIRKFKNMYTNILDESNYNSILGASASHGIQPKPWFQGGYEVDPYESIVQTSEDALNQLGGIL